MSIRLNGATSGSIEIDVPAVAGTDTAITIPATSGGEFIVSDSAGNIDLGPLDINGGAADDSVNIDGSGRILVGTTTVQTIGSGDSQINLVGTDYSTSGIGSTRFQNGVSGASLLLGHSRGTQGAGDYLNNDDEVGKITFWGWSGTGVNGACAYIRAAADGDHDSSDFPSRLVFQTTADNNSAPVERMRIGSNAQITAFQANADTTSLFLNATNGSYTNNVETIRTTRASNSGFNLILMQTASGTDNKFRVRGDGFTFADDSYISTGADYAEYFEWSDGNASEEDRRGISVVLDGDKIREALEGEEPIGVISATPSVVGDSSWSKWSGKYLRDDFGSYILETHNVVSWKETISTEDGQEEIKEHSYEDWNIPADVVVPDDAVISATDENGNAFTHNKLNPDYDPDMEYVPREDRPEWDCVGLMGKLRIRKGQVTGSRWIKMRDISDTVEEWLVR